jgi:hypothetical protein
MCGEKEQVRPKVDDRFWFELSKKMVQSSPTSRNEAAAKLQTMIVWLWGIYTASATVGIALSKTSYPLSVILLIASPSVILIIAYWVAVWVQMPIRAQFDPRIPSDIRDSHNKGVQVKSWRLNCAIGLSFIAAIMVSLALIATSLSKQVTPPNFKATHHTKEGRNLIAFSGHFPADTHVALRISPTPPAIGPLKSKELFYTVSQSGDLQLNIELDFAVKQYEVRAEWKERDGLGHSLKRIITSESEKKKE